VNQTRLRARSAVPTPLFALEVHRAGMPRYPGAGFLPNASAATGSAHGAICDLSRGSACSCVGGMCEQRVTRDAAKPPAPRVARYFVLHELRLVPNSVTSL